MIRFKRFKNIFLLINFFISNGLNGLFNRPIFAKRSTKIILICLLVGMYFIYFSYNMSELMKLVDFSAGISTEIVEKGQRITFFSLLNMIITTGVISFVLVDSTVALDKTSLFFVKTLPFDKKDIELAFVGFKFLLMLMFYSLILFITTPAIQLVTKQPIDFLLFSLVQLFLFVFVIVVVELMRIGIVRLSKNDHKRIPYLIGTYHIILTTSIVAYFFGIRYDLEAYLATLTLPLTHLILLAFTISSIAVLIALVLLYNCVKSDQMIQSNQFIYIPIVEKTIFRNKKIWSFIGFPAFVLLLVAIQSGVSTSLTYLYALFPYCGGLLLHFSDTTGSFRKMFSLYRISVLAEWCYQMALVVLLSLPTIVLSAMGIISISASIQSVGIGIAALTIGFLFPKSEGTINETAALIVLMVMIVLVSLLFKGKVNSAVSLFIFVVTHIYILRKVRYEKK